MMVSNQDIVPALLINLLVLGPHGHMVVQVVGQVVGHQVLAGDADIDGVPVLKLPPQLLQVLLRDGCLGEGRCLEEDEVPHLPGHLLWPGGTEKRQENMDDHRAGYNSIISFIVFEWYCIVMKIGLIVIPSSIV